VYAIVFTSGAVLMALEMLGSRILAPYFGNSIFVWGSLISVFMAALSVGYFAGGYYADKRPHLSTMALVLAAAGFFTVILPWLAPPINNLITEIDLGPRFGPLTAAFCLFFVPSLFMGMVSPLAIRLAVTKLETVGNTAGNLYAVSTLGSIFGTLVTSFFLIAVMGVRRILFLLGIILFALAAAAIWMALTQDPPAGEGGGRESAASRSRQAEQPAKKKKKKGGRIVRSSTAGVVLCLALAGLLSAWAGGGTAWAISAPSDLYATKTLYDKDSLYHHILVVDQGGVRYLKFDASWQSGMDLRRPDALVFEYTHYFHLGPLLVPSAQRALFIGLGGGSVPKNFRINYPQLKMEAAEIDPEVIRVAKTYFYVEEDEYLQCIDRDGRMFLRKSDTLYDLIFLDAYQADSIPFHLSTKEFLEEVAAHLQPDGVVISNIIGAVAGPKSRLFRSMYKTYLSVFPQVHVFPVKVAGYEGDTLPRNIIVVASKKAAAPDFAALRMIAAERQEELPVPSDLVGIIDNRYTKEIPVGDVPLLTDDYAPVDILMHF